MAASLPPLAPACSLPPHLQRYYPAVRAPLPSSSEESIPAVTHIAHPRKAPAASPRGIKLGRIRLPSRHVLHLSFPQTPASGFAASERSKRDSERASDTGFVLEDSARCSSDGMAAHTARQAPDDRAGGAADAGGTASTLHANLWCAEGAERSLQGATAQPNAELLGEQQLHSRATPSAAAPHPNCSESLCESAVAANRKGAKTAAVAGVPASQGTCLQNAAASGSPRRNETAQRKSITGRNQCEQLAAAPALCSGLRKDPSEDSMKHGQTADTCAAAALQAMQQRDELVSDPLAAQRGSWPGGRPSLSGPPAIAAASPQGVCPQASAVFAASKAQQRTQRSSRSMQLCRAMAAEQAEHVEERRVAPSTLPDVDPWHAWWMRSSLEGGGASPNTDLDLLQPARDQMLLELPHGSHPDPGAGAHSAPALRVHAQARSRQPSLRHDSEATRPQRSCSDAGDGVAAFLRSSWADSLDGGFDLAEPFLPEPPIPEGAAWLPGFTHAADQVSADGAASRWSLPDGAGAQTQQLGCDSGNGANAAACAALAAEVGGRRVQVEQAASCSASTEAREAASTLAQAAWELSGPANEPKSQGSKPRSRRGGHPAGSAAANAPHRSCGAGAARRARHAAESVQPMAAPGIAPHARGVPPGVDAFTPTNAAIATDAASVQASAAAPRVGVGRGKLPGLHRIEPHSMADETATPWNARTAHGLPDKAQLVHSNAAAHGALHGGNVPWAARNLSTEFSRAPDVHSCALQLDLLRPAHSLGATEAELVRSPGLKAKAAACVGSPQGVKSPRLANRRGEDACRSQLGMSRVTAQAADTARGMLR